MSTPIYPFIENKYSGWYRSICERSHKRDSHIDQIHRHHVVPKCIWPKDLPGRDDPSNIVSLTAREHFVCHWLLTKMVSNETDLKKLNHALGRMNSNKSLSSRQYQRCQIAHRQAMMGVNHWCYGKKQSLEHVEKRMKNRRSTKGRPLSEEHKRKLSAALTGRKLSKEHREKMSRNRTKEKHPMWGRRHTDETKRKISETKTRKNH